MNINNLIKNLSSTNWEEALYASDELSKYNSEKVFLQLIAVLNTAKNEDTINATSLALREIKNNKATDFLIKSLDNPINIKNKSTILYALETHDCSEYFLKIFTIFIVEKSDDVRLSAYDILMNQKFVLTPSEILKAEELLTTCILSCEDMEITRNILNQYKF